MRIGIAGVRIGNVLYICCLAVIGWNVLWGSLSGEIGKSSGHLFISLGLLRTLRSLDSHRGRFLIMGQLPETKLVKCATRHQYSFQCRPVRYPIKL